MHNIFRILGGSILTIVLFGIIVFGQNTLYPRERERYFSPEIRETALRGGEKLKPFLLGFDNFFADLMWLKAVQYVGGSAAKKDFDVLDAYLNTVTDFDPNFEYAYHFGGLLLPVLKKYDEAKTLLNKGEKNLPDDWQIPYDLGFLLFYYFDDYEGAIRAYQRCTQKVGCLRGAKTLISTLRARVGKSEIAFFNLLEQIQNAKPEEQKFLIEKATEIGKLVLLQQLAKVAPPQKDITELVGKTVSAHDLSGVMQMPEQFFRIVQVVEQFSGQPILARTGKVLPAILDNPFTQNPYLWDREHQEVRLKNW